MHIIDLTILILSLVAVLVVSLVFSRRNKDTEDYFVAGRNLGWFLAGTSMVATTFSADTPLFVAGMTRTRGIGENWFWWCFAIGQIASVFFFARLWRRTEVVTEIEFLTIRYEPGPARNFLRVFRALYEGLLINCFIMAAVLLSVTKITQVLMPYQDEVLFSAPLLGDVNLSVAIMFSVAFLTLGYVLTIGLQGMVWAEALQFGLAMFGSIALGVIVYNQFTEGGQNFTEHVQSLPAYKEGLLDLVPDLSQNNIKTWGFLILITVGWWQFVPSGSYFVQRMLASRSEKDSLLALLWFNVAHYVLRPWPWIIVALASLLYFPQLTDAEKAYPLMVNQFMPVGIKGIMIAALFAAFMSTTFTHLNWGTSYLINDVYKPYLAKGRAERHYVLAGKWAMVFLTVITLVICTRLTSILKTFQFVYAVLGGMSLVMIARWYWWRVNVYSEITALVVALAMAGFLENYERLAGDDYYPVRLLINTIVTTVAWVTVALTTSKAPGPQTISFYQRMRIAGRGWRRVRALGHGAPITGELWHNLKATLACLLFLYSCLLGMGQLVLGQWATGVLGLAVAAGAGLWLSRLIKGIKWNDSSSSSVIEVKEKE